MCLTTILSFKMSKLAGVGHGTAFKTIVDAAAFTILPFVSHPGSVALRHCEPEMILEKFLPGRGALTMTKIFDNDQDRGDKREE